MNSKYLPDYLFDHLVIIGRDSLHEVSQACLNKGFQLTPLAHHNLGSSNRLIMFDSSYIELLGWSKGEIPKRKEIAKQPIGLDALVFRTGNAEECYENLRAQGFLVNPVQDLSRESEYNKETVLVKFKTVRFLEQPIAGLRIYFCEHLTPNYVWQSQWLKHTNQISRLQKINITAPDVQYATKRLTKLLNLESSDSRLSNDTSRIVLPNIEISIQASHIANDKCEITGISLSAGYQNPVDLEIDKQFFKHF